MASWLGFANNLNPADDEEAVEAAEVAFDALDEAPSTTREMTRKDLTGLPDEADIGRINCEDALKETEDLLQRFLKNSYVDAIDEISSKAKLHFAYCQGKANFITLKAIITLDPEEIEKAMKACQEAIDMCNEARRKTGWLASWFWKPITDDYTDEEIHAELGSAELAMMMALLICLTERTIIGLVKAGLRIQSSMGAFLECRRILRERTQYVSSASKAHFESGVRMGIGGYNLITSHLPDRILRLVSFMGMGGNRSYGLKQLEKAAYMESGIRTSLAAMALLGYSIKVEFILGLGEVDFPYVKKLLDHMNTKIEGSALLNIFYGMYEEASGHPVQAIDYYEKAMGRINHWVQAHHACHWLELWCYAVQRDWNKCTEKIKILLDECLWSPATFNYMYAMFLYMKYDDGRGILSTKSGHRSSDRTDAAESIEAIEASNTSINDSNTSTIDANTNTDINNGDNQDADADNVGGHEDAPHENQMPEEIKSEIARMMSIVPGLRHRIAGKTVHLEKFVEMRSYLYFNENESMLLPILDMFYLWNIFPMMQMNPSLIVPFLNDINISLTIYDANCGQRHRYYYLIFFKGICLRYMGDIDSAIECFKTIISCETDIDVYTHLPPHAALELGLIYRKLGAVDEAIDWLNKSIYNYTNYMNATTVHIRAHTAMTIIRQSMEGADGHKRAEDVDAEIEAKLRQMKVDGINESIKSSIDPSQIVEVEDLS